MDVEFKELTLDVFVENYIPGTSANFNGHPDSWYEGTDPEVNYTVVAAKDDDGFPVQFFSKTLTGEEEEELDRLVIEAYKCELSYLESWDNF